MNIAQRIRRIEEIRRELPVITEMIIQRSKDRILNLIREDQLFEEGIDGRGRPLQPYTPFTMAVKRAEGKDPNTVTLFDTGDFYRGFDLVFNDQFVIGVFSRDPKTPDIEEKYGNDIFTFTVENNKILNENIIKPQLVRWVLQQLNALI